MSEAKVISFQAKNTNPERLYERMLIDLAKSMDSHTRRTTTVEELFDQTLDLFTDQVFSRTCHNSLLQMALNNRTGTDEGFIE